MLAGMKYACALIASYVIAWTVAYAAYVMPVGLDFRFYLEYLALGWMHAGCELPTILHGVSLILFFPIAVVATVGLFVIDRRRRRAMAS